MQWKRKYLFFLVLGLMVLQSGVNAQDERFFRELLTGDLPQESTSLKRKVSKWMASSPLYKIDLNDDGELEEVLIEARDGTHWATVYGRNQQKLHTFAFETVGGGAHVYKVLVKRLSRTAKALLFYFYEGELQTTNFDSRVRLYFMAFDSNDLRFTELYKGPIVWTEHVDGRRDNYTRRKYVVNVKDFNGDGVKEVAVRHHLTSRIYFYTGRGNWKAL